MPFGFDYRLPCQRHDWGYRNFHALGVFSANKARMDWAFYVDMRAVCARYRFSLRTLCDATAWTYYEAVRLFGSPSVSQQRLDGLAHQTGRSRLAGAA